MQIVCLAICTTHLSKGSASMNCEAVNLRKRLFLPGSRVQLTETMRDSYTPLPRGLTGIVRHVDDIGTVHIQWENGSSLGAVLEDKIQLI